MRELPIEYGHIRKVTATGNIAIPAQYWEEMHVRERTQIMFQVTWDETGRVTLQPITVTKTVLPVSFDKEEEEATYAAD